MSKASQESLEQRLDLLERAVAEVARQWALSPQHAPAAHTIMVRHGLRLETTAAAPVSEVR